MAYYNDPTKTDDYRRRQAFEQAERNRARTQAFEQAERDRARATHESIIKGHRRAGAEIRQEIWERRERSPSNGRERETPIVKDSVWISSGHHTVAREHWAVRLASFFALAMFALCLYGKLPWISLAYFMGAYVAVAAVVAIIKNIRTILKFATLCALGYATYIWYQSH